jgi:RNA polymerase sigma-54 factor
MLKVLGERWRKVLELELKTAQRQELSLSPQLLQAMEILRMNASDLCSFIQTELQENPVLEAELNSAPYEDAALLHRKLEWLNSQPGRRQSSVIAGDDPAMDLADRLSVPQWEESLEAHLVLQLQSLGLNPSEEHCARFLIRCVDKRGYLNEDAAHVARLLGLDTHTVIRVLSLLRTLDPPGICAADLKGCLAAQLRDCPDGELALSIVDAHLEDLARGRYAAIAKSLGAATDRVLKACERIRSLDPCPGSAFTSGEAPVYIIPDILIHRTEDGFDVRLNGSILPELGISGYYSSLLKDNDSEELRCYLSERFQRARWLIASVEKRHRTLLACAKAVVKLQREYFLRNTEHLKPMALADVAALVDMHPSTVSRALRDKYLQYDGGVCAVKDLFTRVVGGSGDGCSSSDRARLSIRRLIEGEDKARPYSDSRICELLAKDGVEISRRTVAKYREEMGVPGTAVRRER